MQSIKNDSLQFCRGQNPSVWYRVDDALGCASESRGNTTKIISYPVITFNECRQGLFRIWLISDLYELNPHRVGMVSGAFQPCHGMLDNVSWVVSYKDKIDKTTRLI